MMNAAESPPIPLSGARPWPVSVAAYHALAELGFIHENTELLYGVVYTKMPKSPLHSSLVRRFSRLLKASLPPGILVDTEQPIACEGSEPEPDISAVKGMESDFWKDHPHTAEMVVEVCVTSHDYDRSKLRAYASAGVKECWLVLAPERQIEVHREPKEGQYSDCKTYGPGGTIASAALPGFSLSLDELFVM